ncbi:MAG: hypothetical protein HYV42_03080 [Candidatus Magasanikbacteria bacterium]|nr:hypothetical protein [Candidatus Magasanikbacteria bacterium]
MALNDIEQIKQLVQESRYPLVLFEARAGGDAAGSALALYGYLKSAGQRPEIAASGWQLPRTLAWLPGANAIKPELTHLQKFIIKVDVSQAPVETLSYDVKDGWLSIYLTPKQGNITRRELRTAQSAFKYDLIVTVGAPDLAALGDIYLNNTDLFHRLPLINLDNAAANERFGAIALVNPAAASLSEVVYRLLLNIEATAITSDIATALLTGLTIATDGFRHPRLKPAALQLAGELVEHGADRERVIRELYRTRSVAALKLWGQALAHLTSHPNLGLIVTTLTRDDFTRAGATPEDLGGMVEELIAGAPEAKRTLLLYEVPGAKAEAVQGIFTVNNDHDNAAVLLSPLQPTGTKKQASVTLPGKTLSQAEETVLKIIKEALATNS